MSTKMIQTANRLFKNEWSQRELTWKMSFEWLIMKQTDCATVGAISCSSEAVDWKKTSKTSFIMQSQGTCYQPETDGAIGIRNIWPNIESQVSTIRWSYSTQWLSLTFLGTMMWGAKSVASASVVILLASSFFTRTRSSSSLRRSFRFSSGSSCSNSWTVCSCLEEAMSGRTSWIKWLSRGC